jgi:hypothetical protein
VSALSFARDGSRLLSISRAEGRWLLRDIDNPLDMKNGAPLAGAAQGGALLPGGTRALLFVPTPGKESSEDMALVDLDSDTTLMTLVPRCDADRCGAGSNDGKCLAFPIHADEVVLTSGEGSNRKAELKDLPDVRDLAFSPDGHTLGIATARGLLLRPVDAAGPPPSTVDAVWPLRCVKFSPAGDMVFACGPGGVLACNVQGKVIWSRGDMWPTGLDVIPARWALIVREPWGNLGLLHAATGAWIRTLETLRTTSFAVSPESERIALGYSDGSIDILSLSDLLAR